LEGRTGRNDKTGEIARGQREGSRNARVNQRKIRSDGKDELKTVSEDGRLREIFGEGGLGGNVRRRVKMVEAA